MFTMRPFSFSALVRAISGCVSVVAVLIAMNVSPARAAGPQRFTSGPNRVALLELYTSEGCSSCPPADRWLSGLRDDPGLWRDFVPVAFHVDYWNGLGWPDRFSAREYTQRQYDLAAAWGTNSVYTPCVVRDGAESRARERPSASGQPAAGTLTATYDGATLRAEFAPAGAAKNAASASASASASAYEIHAALLGGGIVSKVTAGENSGETLKHDFVALALASGAPGRDLALTVTNAAKTKSVTRQAVAIWVTKRGDLTPLQATGGWLDAAR